MSDAAALQIKQVPVVSARDIDIAPFGCLLGITDPDAMVETDFYHGAVKLLKPGVFQFVKLPDGHRQRFTADELHRVIGMFTLQITDVVHRNNPGVLQPSRDLRLPFESQSQRR